MKTKNILVIGFQKKDVNMYPPLWDFVNEFGKYHHIDYFHFRTRDLIRDIMFPNSILSFIKNTVLNFKDIMNLMLISNKYDLVIAFDQYAFLCSSYIFRKNKVIHWSYDIYPYEPYFLKKRRVKFYLSLQKKSQLKNPYLIIQDQSRESLLRDVLNIKEDVLNIFYLPISLKKVEPFLLSESMKFPVLIQLGPGNIKCSDKLLDHFQKSNNRYRLIFHGHINNWLKKLLVNKKYCPIISDFSVNGDSLSNIVNYCDIGFVGYETYSEYDKNGYLISHASGQLVEFLRIKKPIISMGNTNMKDLVNHYKIGVHIETIEELNNAIDIIRDNYNLFSNNCYKLYLESFCSEKNYSKLANWINNFDGESA